MVKESSSSNKSFVLPQNFLFKSTGEDSSLKATDFGLSDFIKPGKCFNSLSLLKMMICYGDGL